MSGEKYPVEFIVYYTGDYPKTIEEAYQTWLRIKDDEDFEEFHPDTVKIINEYLKEKEQ